MKQKPDYEVGDEVVFKSGKRGKHFGLKNGHTAEVVELKNMFNPPVATKGEWGGWLVKLSTSNTFFPASWFE